MSIDRWMAKEVAYAYNGILVNHKKEWVWVHSSEVGEPRACYTEWSKLERERQKSFINSYIWHLEEWYCWAYLQGRDRNADPEDRLVDTATEGEDGTNWKSSVETYISICRTDRRWEAAIQHRKLYSALRNNLEEWDLVAGGREFPERGAYV